MIDDIKQGLSVSLTMQIEDYEPVKISVYRERTRGDETDEEFNLNLAKETLKSLDDLAPDIVLKIREIKKNIEEAYSDA